MVAFELDSCSKHSVIGKWEPSPVLTSTGEGLHSPRCQAHFQAPKQPQEHANSHEREETHWEEERDCLRGFMSRLSNEVHWWDEEDHDAKDDLTQMHHKEDRCAEWYSSPCPTTPTLLQQGVCHSVCNSKGLLGHKDPWKPSERTTFHQLGLWPTPIPSLEPMPSSNLGHPPPCTD